MPCERWSPSIAAPIVASDEPLDPLTLVAATLICILVQLSVRFGVEAALRKRARVLFRRPDTDGRTEGHLLARAALTHFDQTHTLRSCLLLWKRTLQEMEQMTAVLVHLRCVPFWRGALDPHIP